MGPSFRVTTQSSLKIELLIACRYINDDNIKLATQYFPGLAMEQISAGHWGKQFASYLRGPRFHSLFADHRLSCTLRAASTSSTFRKVSPTVNISIIDLSNMYTNRKTAHRNLSKW